MPTRIFGVYCLLHETIARFASLTGRAKSKQDACHYCLSDAGPLSVFLNAAAFFNATKRKAYACCNGIIRRMARKASITNRHLRRASRSALVAKPPEASFRVRKMHPHWQYAVYAEMLGKKLRGVNVTWYLGHNWTFSAEED